MGESSLIGLMGGLSSHVRMFRKREQSEGGVISQPDRIRIEAAPLHAVGIASNSGYSMSRESYLGLLSPRQPWEWVLPE